MCRFWIFQFGFETINVLNYVSFSTKPSYVRDTVSANVKQYIVHFHIKAKGNINITMGKVAKKTQKNNKKIPKSGSNIKKKV